MNKHPLHNPDPEDVPEIGERLSEWKQDCLLYWGRELTGKKAHWCPDWDFLPIDETTGEEYSHCSCLDVEEEQKVLVNPWTGEKRVLKDDEAICSLCSRAYTLREPGSYMEDCCTSCIDERMR